VHKWLNSLNRVTYTPPHCIYIEFIELTNLTPPLFTLRLILIRYHIKGSWGRIVLIGKGKCFCCFNTQFIPILFFSRVVKLLGKKIALI
jgi:hypothetical protein